MKTKTRKVVWIVLGGIAILIVVSVLVQSHWNSNAKKALADTRRDLREQGFKTELSDFYVATNPATRARAAAVRDFYMTFLKAPLSDEKFLPMDTDDSATVIWKNEGLRIRSFTLHWNSLRDELDAIRKPLDAARDAVLSGPIGFNMDWNQTYSISNDYPSQLRYLATALSDSVMVDLHDNNWDAAWTNLLAQTRVITASEPNGGVSPLLCLLDVPDAAFVTTWQALQFNGWPDEKLAVLQQEWQSLDYLTNLPERAAFERVWNAHGCCWISQEPPFKYFHFSGFTAESLQDFKQALNRMWFHGHPALVEERIMLLYFRDRELELRRAIQAPTWKEMRALPGVTNVASFISPYSLLSNDINYYYRGGQVLELSHVAEAEAERRVLITAIALERYRNKYHVYPTTLASLVPEFLKAVPLDFMDGLPLRYRLTGDGHFVLYSIRLDCVDDGGKLVPPNSYHFPRSSAEILVAPTDMDIIWPRPANP